MSTSAYDKVRYPGYSHPQTHPGRLEAIGMLMGLQPVPALRCRVLEVGCGNGSNLVPMAWGMPQSEFLGIDLAATRISEGQEMIRALSLSNVRLHQGDLVSLNESWGKFDYIIAHGIYSWVPAEVQQALLETCRKLLAPQGIAFVSYNAYPGGHLRNMVRDMMRFHVREIKAPDERVLQAQALARFVSGAQDTRDDARLCVKAEFDHVIDHDDGHLYHDELAEINEPLYFTQFVERASAHGLQYLAEADYHEMFDYGFKEPAREVLRQFGGDRILREQYLDFLKCRRFRQNLLCHREVHVQMDVQVHKVAQLMISSAAVCDGGPVDLRPDVKSSYLAPNGSRCQTDFALGKAALAALGKIWPISLSFDDLRQRALEILKRNEISGFDHERAREGLCSFFSNLYSAGMVEFQTVAPPLALAASEQPEASPIARWQAQRGHLVTSLLHRTARLEDEIGPSLLCWLDGTADRAALAEKLWEMLKSKNALVIAGGDEAVARREVESNLNQNLEKLAKLGLLVA